MDNFEAKLNALKEATKADRREIAKHSAWIEETRRTFMLFKFVDAALANPSIDREVFEKLTAALDEQLAKAGDL